MLFRSLVVLAVFWRQLVLVFFDEPHARTLGQRTEWLRIGFFLLLSAAIVSALQAVGAVLVVAMVIAPGATAYLLSDRFGPLLLMAGGMGTVTAALGAYASFFLDGATGALIVLLQVSCFLAAFLFAPKHGYLARRKLVRASGGAS